METIKYIEAYMDVRNDNFTSIENIYNKGYYINKTNEIKKENKNPTHFSYIKIPISYKTLPSIESFENYNETLYTILKYEYLYYNDLVETYFKRGDFIIPHKNLENNIFRKYLSIKDIERKMK